MKPLKARLPLVLLAVAGSVLATGAASAGTWHLNAGACPDLREDRIDARHTSGRFDRLEDMRDRSVIDCPVSAWSYEPDRWERDRHYMRIAAQPRSPGLVYLAGDGGYYVRDYQGQTRWIDVEVHYPRAFNGRRFAPARSGFDRYPLAPHPRDRHPVTRPLPRPHRGW